MLARYIVPQLAGHCQFQARPKGDCVRHVARVLWCRISDQAIVDGASNIDDARTVGHGLSLCYSLVEAACPVALFAGDLVVRIAS